ncbi:MAG: ABC-F type ribosomal protection protein [Clostridiaceae bacterium]|nr:ABC-F type ribosomal protection protein [Clostridiaceae bacterium]
MSLINVTNLTFRYDGSYDDIFTDVTFRLDTSWKLGFVGRNGRGKTTFLRLLMGEYEYRGSISASVDFEYFPYPVREESAPTREILAAICPGAPDWHLERELALLDVTPDALGRPYATLSGGERTKVLLAAMFLRENAFLLIDEPTNHLDLDARARVSDYLAHKSGFILVSHDRAFLDGCVDHILAINKANIALEAGNYSSWEHNKALRDQFELDTDERLRRDIRRLQDSARQSSEWADKVENTKIGFDPRKTEKQNGTRAYIGEQSRRMQQRRKNLERRQTRAIEEKSALLKNIERADDLKIWPLTYHTDRLIELRDVSIFYDGRKISEPVRFDLMQGERVFLRGKNGSGKSSILKLITGEPIEHSGSVTVASGLTFSVVPQDSSFLTGSLDDFIEHAGVDGTLMRTILRKLDFERVQFTKDMRGYSAGQKKKVLLARSLATSAHVYIWDEPLNYIDLYSRVQLENLIRVYVPTMLLVEHDAAFADAVATKIVSL